MSNLHTTKIQINSTKNTIEAQLSSIIPTLFNNHPSVFNNTSAFSYTYQILHTPTKHHEDLFTFSVFFTKSGELLVSGTYHNNHFSQFTTNL